MARHWLIRCGRRTFDLYNITVEPVMFLYMFATFLNFPTLQNLLFDKVCLGKFNHTFCSNMYNQTCEESHENEIQAETSHWILKMNIAMAVPSLVIVFFFLGSWGDTVGRKIPVLLPCIGFFISCIVNLLNSLFMSASPGYLLFGQIINGFFGGYIAVIMAIVSYTTHISTETSRTTRLGIVESMTFLAGTFGIFISGVLLNATSYTFVYGLLSVVMLVAILYVVLWLEEIRPERPETLSSATCYSRVVESLRRSAQCMVQRRPDMRNCRLGALIAAITILMMCTLGENDVALLFVKKAPLCWSATLYGYFKALENFTRFLLVVTFLPFAKLYLHLHDCTLIAIGLVSKAASMLLFGFAQQTWMVFLVPVLSAFQGLPSAGIRSQMSGMVELEEQGRLFSVVACLENVSQILATLIFNQLYPATFHLTPGFCFFFIAGLVILDLVIILTMHFTVGRKYITLVEEPVGEIAVTGDALDVNTAEYEY